MCEDKKITVSGCEPDERFYWYRLLTVADITPAIIDKLLRVYPSPRGIFTDGSEIMLRAYVAGYDEASGDALALLTDSQIHAIEKAKKEMAMARDEYASLESRGIRMVLRGDPDYPDRLRGIPDEPYGFFLIGRLPDPDRPAVAMVGARRATTHGKWFARKLAHDLAEKGVTVISGMAEGIDGCSHEGALDAMFESRSASPAGRGGFTDAGSSPAGACGETLAVLGSGIDEIFPKVNTGLYHTLSVSGGIISEYGPGVRGMAYHFPARNRIISALADAVIVVEAREKSGSLITVCRALEQGRDVMAVPGRPDDPCSMSCNRLIREGAGVCTCAADVLDYLQVASPIQRRKISEAALRPATGTGKPQGGISLGTLPGISDPVKHPNASRSPVISDPEKRLIYSKLSGEPMHIDYINQATGISLLSLIPLLTSMELEGLISSVSGSMYRIN